MSRKLAAVKFIFDLKNPQSHILPQQTILNSDLSQPTGPNRMGHIRPVHNRFVQIYDLRMMKAAAPLQPKFDPRFLRFIPTFTSRLLIFSTTGDLVIVEPRHECSINRKLNKVVVWKNIYVHFFLCFYLLIRV